MEIEKIETNLKRNLRLHSSKIKLVPNSKKIENLIIRVEPDITFQEILGFGGALTESACYVLSTIKKDISERILDEYFSKDKLNYQFTRISIGSCDFSLDSYSYSYENDLSDFNIDRDLKYVIPIIKAAQNRNNNLQIISSPWSPPKFMKDNNNLIMGGKLLSKYKKLWANYLVKYVLSYKSYGIPIQYMTIQNEPNAKQLWESCLYSATEEADLLKNYLFPIFKEHKLNTKFLIWDHNKDVILERCLETLIDNNCLDYASGIAFHWYTGGHFESLSRLNNLFPKHLLFHTEGCTGYSHFNPQDELFNCEMYASEIMEDFNHGVNAFIDWNIVLNFKRWSKSY
ncbi:MAG: glucosylceramidase [Clostridia bacterium]|nr:glucosylceramidase [Clostridia bacterium]